MRVGSQPHEELGGSAFRVGGDSKGNGLEADRNKGCLRNQERAEGLDQGQGTSTTRCPSD